MTTKSSIERLHTLIVRNLFYVDPALDYDRITDALISLANAIHAYTGDNDDWCYIGESDYPLTDILTGAYWHFCHWHAGQWSNSYKALCALGQVYRPNRETEDYDNLAFMELEILAEAAQ